ncbi:hypothetical protein MIMGU_mgv1a024718mg [Erythranthe guttata]|uniref:RING-type domain-containing protein n=1 Tax=Erythranthe guttata TaxID=4155 RepID=A0A022PYA0_ERYGU|nr:hypothetical protein MIMGU_mgv1a024718mg [Erythranthe guttata]
MVNGISLILSGFIVFAIVFYIYMRLFYLNDDPSSPINGSTGPDPVIVTVHQSNGLDARGIKGSYASACSICLADYGEADLIRLLPSCGHLFHLKCIDPWLILHPTCPVCRSSPSPQI